jgi:hypothetical protein
VTPPPPVAGPLLPHRDLLPLLYHCVGTRPAAVHPRAATATWEPHPCMTTEFKSGTHASPHRRSHISLSWTTEVPAILVQHLHLPRFATAAVHHDDEVVAVLQRQQWLVVVGEPGMSSPSRRACGSEQRGAGAPGGARAATQRPTSSSTMNFRWLGETEGDNWMGPDY